MDIEKRYGRPTVPSSALPGLPRRAGGSIYRDGDDRWRGYVDLGYGGGRRRRKYVNGTTRREVAAKLRDAATARDAGTLVVVQTGQTVAEWLTFWLESIAAAKVRPSTRRQSATPPAGRSLLRSAFDRARHSASDGTTSTSTTGR
jgi:hypothetical protein